MAKPLDLAQLACEGLARLQRSVHGRTGTKQVLVAVQVQPRTAESPSTGEGFAALRTDNIVLQI